MTDLYYRLHHLLAATWRRRYVILIPILLLPVLGLVVGIVTPKKYKAHTSMLIQETAKMNPFLEDLAVSSMLSERMAALETLLHSRHILGAVAEQRGLVTEQSSPEERDEIIAQLSKRLTVRMGGKDLIRIDYTSDRAEGMREMLETVSEQFVDQLLAPERSSIKDSAYFLAQHLKARRQDLDDAEGGLAKYRDEHAAALPELHASNINRLAQLRQRLAEREAELGGAERAMGGLDRQLSRTNPLVGRLEEQIVTIRGELALLRARYTDGHSRVQAAKRQIRRLEDERHAVLTLNEQQLDAAKLWDMASATGVMGDERTQPLLVSQLENLQLARGKTDSLTEETSRLRTLISELERKTAGYGQQQRELGRLKRDMDVKRKLYEDLLHRYEMARVTGSLGSFEQSKRVKVIDRPFSPTRPSNLPPVLFAIAGLIAGVLLGSGLALFLEITDTTVRRRDVAQQLTGLPVLARLSHNSPSTTLVI